MKPLESLVVYLKFIKDQEYFDHDEFLEKAAADDDAAGFVEDEMNKPRAVEKFHRWCRRNGVDENELLGLAEIDIDDLYRQAVEQIFAEEAVSQETPRDENSHAPGPYYFEKYVDAECGNDQEAQKNLRDDVNSLWDRLNSYADKNNGRAYGLAVGRVQSGKTRNYIGLMFKAIENGYNTILILTSKSNQLALQTYDRVEEWIGKRRFDLPNGLMLSTVRKDNEGYNIGIDWSGNGWSPNKVNVGVIIKNAKGHLEDVHSWLSNLGEENLRQMRLLFIDDESDNATPNSNSAAEPDIKDEKSLETFLRFLEETGREVQECMIAANWARVVSGKINQTIDSSPNYSDQEMECLQKILRKYKKYGELFNAIQGDDEARMVLKIGTSENVGNIKWSVIESVFRHNARGGNRPNQKQFRELLNYVFEIHYERSKINLLISEIVCSARKTDEPVFNYGRLLYVGYTATPFANIINENPTEDPLCPDCIKPLSVSSRYFGLGRIFGAEVKYENSRPCRMNVVRTIPEEDKEGWVRPIQEPSVIGFRVTRNGIEGADLSQEEMNNANKEEFEIATQATQPWRSLVKAVQWAFCTAAARRVMRKGNQDKKVSDDHAKINYRWTTMLFNLSQRVDRGAGVHSVQKKIVQAYVNFVRRAENRDVFTEECHRLWEDETTRQFSRDAFVRACPEYGELAGYPKWEDVKECLCDWFLNPDNEEKVRVVQFNASSDERIEYNDEAAGDYGDILWIVCGGNAISRGLTLHGLTVSYFDRVKKSSTVDAITQMGRWFGYRRGYELLPRIWMSDETVETMKAICRTEDQLHESLREQFEAEDETSIREGRDVALIRYFGRRLTSRDANSEQLDGVSAYGVFNCVQADSTAAINETREFLLNALGLDRVFERTADVGYDKALHQRHRYFWRNIEAVQIMTYLEAMRANAFCEASRGGLAGLVRDIGNSAGRRWNVVIDSPDERGGDSYQNVIPAITEVRLRHNAATKVQGGLRIGHSAIPVDAFLAGVQSRYITEGMETQANHHGSNPEMLRSVFAVVERQYQDANDGADREDLAAALNPTLAISFVHVESGQTYIRLTFYWPGHTQESYLRAIIRPATPAYVTEAVRIVERQHYISMKALKRLVEQVFSDFDENDFREEMKEYTRSSDACIGIIQDGDLAERYVLCPHICYSRSWASTENAESPADIARKIGLDLYRRIIDNNWNHYNGLDRLDFGALAGNDLDWIMQWEYLTRTYNWPKFSRVYGAPALAENHRQITRSMGETIVEPGSLEDCARRFGTTNIRGVEYVFVDEAWTTENSEAEHVFFRSVVPRGAMQNRYGEYEAFKVECREEETNVDGFENTSERFKYNPRIGRTIGVRSIAKDWFERHTRFTPAIIRVLHLNNVNTVADLVAFVESGRLRRCDGIGPQKATRIEDVSASLKVRLEDDFDLNSAVGPHTEARRRGSLRQDSQDHPDLFLGGINFDSLK